MHRLAARAGRPTVRAYGWAGTVTRMKTTIDLPDALAREAKDVARGSGTTLRDLVVAGLAAEIDRRRAPRADFVLPTAGGLGLEAGLDPADAIARSYDPPA